MTKNKKGSTLIWILVILILVGAGISIYFWLTGSSPVGASSIPQPPALPLR